MSIGAEKRRSPRVAIACTVSVREKAAVWSTATQDVAARGCRIALRRPLASGAVVQLQFERGRLDQPLEVPGQVIWTREEAPPAAGIAFLGAPRDASGRTPASWIDELVAAHLRRALRAGSAEAGARRAGRLVLRLGVAPAHALERREAAVVRAAQREGPLAAVCRSPEALRTVISLLDRGVVSVCDARPDAAQWLEALDELDGGARARVPAAPRRPERTGRADSIADIVAEYLRSP